MTKGTEKTTKKNKVIYDPYCSVCDATWERKDKKNYCPDCGSKLKKQFDCLICGKPVAGDWVYCGSCGVKVAKIE